MNKVDKILITIFLVAPWLTYIAPYHLRLDFRKYLEAVMLLPVNPTLLMTFFVSLVIAIVLSFRLKGLRFLVGLWALFAFNICIYILVELGLAFSAGRYF